MKKLLIIIFLFLLTGCTEKELEKKPITYELDEKMMIETNVDKNPIKIGLYKDNTLVKSASTTLDNNKDIDSYYVYYTNDETLSSNNVKTNYNKYYQEYSNIDEYKTGFYISFEVEEKTIEKTILDASATYSMSPYLFIYLYDDINVADGIWYSHLKQEDVNENTILSSIKLYLAQEGSKITSPIELTVFTYDNDDLDEFNNYLGNNKYTLIIETK